IAHEVLGPEHGAEADGEHRDSGPEADEHVVQANALHRLAGSEQEVGHDEPDGSDHRQDEPAGHVTVGDLLRAWIRVDQARLVLRPTWGDGPVQLLEVAAAAGGLVRGQRIPRLFSWWMIHDPAGLTSTWMTATLSYR